MNLVTLTWNEAGKGLFIWPKSFSVLNMKLIYSLLACLALLSLAQQQTTEDTETRCTVQMIEVKDQQGNWSPIANLGASAGGAESGKGVSRIRDRVSRRESGAQQPSMDYGQGGQRQPSVGGCQIGQGTMPRQGSVQYTIDPRADYGTLYPRMGYYNPYFGGFYGLDMAFPQIGVGIYQADAEAVGGSEPVSQPAQNKATQIAQILEETPMRLSLMCGETQTQIVVGEQ